MTDRSSSRRATSSGRARDVEGARTGRSLSDAVRAEPDDGRLDGGERQQVLDTLIAVLGGAYAHLPAKRAAYAVDPVHELELLRRRSSDLTEAEFHLAVTGIVTRLRDAHTRYIGPSRLREQVAALPFLVEQYGPFDAPRYVVTKTAGVVAGDEAFKAGVRLDWWNGIPFDRAVELYADRETGGRADARRARALESLTFRALDYGPPPDEHWVVVGYRTRRGGQHEVKVPWQVYVPGKAATAAKPGSRAQAKQAADPAAEAVRRAKKRLFAPTLWLSEDEDARQLTASARVPLRTPIPTSFQDTLSAQRLTASLGYLRIWSFDVDDDDAFLDEVTRLLGLLPQDRLIVDLRGNPGGLVWAAERLLQLFVDHPPGQAIAPTRFQLVASPLTREMASNPFNRLELQAWAASLEDAVSTGEQYAQPLPLTDPSWCNDRARVYPGRAVAVVDANTYSSGDLFSAGWVDNAVGPLVCVGRATGAGGANVWTSNQLRDALTGTDHQFATLPAGVGFTIAIRRAIRSGLSDGIPIEDLGISGIPYDMTENDVLSGNKDLYAFCANVIDQSG
ncbi:S41 family peptidase [Angustibacter sp. McL0619]|uniref:S41 family peptidase n=1 Tax=Angustibacter sp. McL0619 TaxID=3415676 RepID=UPI003CEBC9A7